MPAPKAPVEPTVILDNLPKAHPDALMPTFRSNVDNIDIEVTLLVTDRGWTVLHQISMPTPGCPIGLPPP